MQCTRETPTQGGGAPEGLSLHGDNPANSQPPIKRQDLFADIQREIVELNLRVAAAQLARAAVFVATGDDEGAWGCVIAADARLTEGAGVLRELEAAP